MIEKNDILAKEAKHLVVTYLGLDLKAWPLTEDKAWISFAANLLKQRARA